MILHTADRQTKQIPVIIEVCFAAAVYKHQTPGTTRVVAGGTPQAAIAAIRVKGCIKVAVASGESGKPTSVITSLVISDITCRKA